MTTKVYTSDGMTAIFGPVIMDSGRGDDEFCRVEMESDAFEDFVGVDGEVTVSRTNDGRATATMTLAQTSDKNDQLSAIYNTALTADGMAGGVYPFLLKDKNGRTVFEAQNAWIMKAPDATFSRGPTTREWPIRCAKIVRLDGGNTSL